MIEGTVPERAASPVPWLDGCAYGVSDVGVVRRVNEDAFLIDNTLGLLVLADGMGGHANGALASSAAIATLRDHLRGAIDGMPRAGAAAPARPDPDSTSTDVGMPALRALFEAVDAANRRLFELNAERGAEPGRGMGSTLIGLWNHAVARDLLCFHVGDSRLYCLRAGRLVQITRDHSARQAAIDAGTLDHLPQANVLTRAVGPCPEVQADIGPVASQSGDVFLLCSDGVHGVVPEERIAALLREAAEGDLAAVCATLVQLAVTYGGTDNATAIVARRAPTPAAAADALNEATLAGPHRA